MDKKPVILIAWGPCIDAKFYAPGMMLTKAYEYAVAANGGVPMIPLDENSIDEYVALADGLILPGAQFESPKPGVAQLVKCELSNSREAFQTALFNAFFEAGKPIMGICEGCQKINCCLGGKLNLELQETFDVFHWNTAHGIKTEKGSFINDLWGDEPFVNSFHNFYCEELGEGLRTTSLSPEGTCESIEHESKPVYGFQFHPERMRGDEPFPPDGADGNKAFRAFAEKCAEIRDNK